MFDGVHVLCLHVCEPELLMWFRFMCVSCSGMKQSRSLPVLGSPRPPVVFCPITLQSSAFTAYSGSIQRISFSEICFFFFSFSCPELDERIDTLSYLSFIYKATAS